MNSTEIIFVIDKSGSMARLTNDTIEGFNGFIENQKDDTKTTLTTVLFDTSWKILHNGIDVYEVKPMTKTDYIAGGGTAMLDAIGETINRVQDRHDELGNDKPDKVLFVITTDGEENSSHKFTKAQIEKMIKHQTNGHGWTFMFLGANMDAVKEAESIGIKREYSANYDWSVQGTDALFATASTVATAAKSCTVDALEVDLQSAYDIALNTISSDAKTYSDIAANVTTISG